MPESSSSAFTPDAPFEKSRGDLIRSKDWNDAIHEIQRLDTAKLNKTGGAISGPLSISGNVSIGTSSVNGTLDVQGPIRAGQSDIYFTNTSHNHTAIGNAVGFAAIENASNYSALMILGRAGTTRGRYVRLWDFLRVDGSLEVRDSAFKPGGGSWSSISDIRLKTNVNQLQGALEKLLRLRGVTFEWKEPEEQGGLAGIQTGLVAQEVENVFPEWVDTTPEGVKYLSIRGFEALVVEALRNLDQRIKALESAKGKGKANA